MAGKLQKLILMLSSSHDGEVVAAARAIGKFLKADKKDWHWLVQRLDGAPDDPEDEPEDEEPEPAQRRTYNYDEHRGGWHGNREGWTDWRQLTPEEIQELHYCNLHAATGGLNGKQKIFVKEMAARYGNFGKETRMTGAQRSYMHSIYEKLRDSPTWA